MTQINKPSVAAAFALRTFTDLPPRNTSGNSIYPFKAMEPGVMFFVPLTKEGEKETSKKLSTAASQAGRALGRQFSVRSMEEDGVQGVGVFCLREDEAIEEVAEGDKTATESIVSPDNAAGILAAQEAAQAAIAKMEGADA